MLCDLVVEDMLCIKEFDSTCSALRFSLHGYNLIKECDERLSQGEGIQKHKVMHNESSR